MERFNKILSLKNRNLDYAVCKTIYALSCAEENIPKMAEHKVLEIILMLWNRELQHEQQREGEGEEKEKERGNGEESLASTTELHSTKTILIGTMYNLSTLCELHTHLIKVGYIELLIKMWPEACKVRQSCLLACYSVYHMACGAADACQFISCDCAPVLCFVWSAHEQNIPEYKGYFFPLDMQLRCAIAIRNMMYIVSNQEALMAAGCVDALVSIAQEVEAPSPLPATRRASGRRPHENIPIFPANKKPPPFKNEADQRIHEETRMHCAAALRSLTFNEKVRDELLSRGAVTVLLDDLNASMKDDSIPMDFNLMCQLEAESWQNGSRSGAATDQARIIAPAPQERSFLTTPQKIRLNVTVKTAILEKYRVQVQLEEPLIEQGGGFDALPEDMTTLVTLDDQDDNGTPAPSHCGRKEWPALDIIDALASIETAEKFESSSMLVSTPQRKKGNNMHETLAGTPDAECKGVMINQFSSLSSRMEEWKAQDQDRAGSTLRRSIDIASRCHRGSLHNSPSQKAVSAALPKVRNRRSLLQDLDHRGPLNINININVKDLEKSHTSDFPPISSLCLGHPAKKLVRKNKESVDNFDSLVSLINNSRKTNGNIGDVLNKWSKISSK